MSPESRDHRGILRDCELPLGSNPSLRRLPDPLPPPRPSVEQPRMREPGGRTLAPGTAGPAAHARRPLPAATGTQRSIRSSHPHPAPGHDGALLRPPGRHLHHVLGPHRHRRALVRAQRTQPRVRIARGPAYPGTPLRLGPLLLPREAAAMQRALVPAHGAPVLLPGPR